MPRLSDRQRIIQDLQDTLEAASFVYSVLIQSEIDTTLFSLLSRSSSGSLSSSTRSSATSSTSTRSDDAQETVTPLSDGVLNLIRYLFDCYTSVMSHRYLEREIGRRKLHLKRTEFFEYTLGVEPTVFKYLVSQTWSVCNYSTLSCICVWTVSNESLLFSTPLRQDQDASRVL